jgi:uncharacterized protein (DUF2164 family)
MFHRNEIAALMNTGLTSEQKADALFSLQRYFDENLDSELNELQATLLLDYIMREIAPIAYNRGVEDARAQLFTMAEDLPGICFAEAFTYWEERSGSGRAVRRKPDR